MIYCVYPFTARYTFQTGILQKLLKMLRKLKKIKNNGTLKEDFYNLRKLIKTEIKTAYEKYIKTREEKILVIYKI